MRKALIEWLYGNKFEIKDPTDGEFWIINVHDEDLTHSLNELISKYGNEFGVESAPDGTLNIVAAGKP